MVVLSACASVPIHQEIDLKASMDASVTEGSASAEVKAGEVEELDLRLPTDAGACIDFAGTAPGATLQSAQLQWIVDASYDGPDLTGKLQARAYVAGVNDDVFHPSHTLGPVFTINLDKTTTRLAGAAVLNPTQLEAVNDREVCWGVEVTGEDVAALEDGTATIDYSIKQLRLKVTFSVI